MGLLDRLKKAFSSQNDGKAIKSMDNRFESIGKRDDEPKAPSLTVEPEKKPVALTTGLSNYREEQINRSNTSLESSEPDSMTVQKGSYDLGLAAGYTGHSIKQIEASLSRVEAQMVTKDWFLIQLNQLDRRIEDIEKALGIIKGAIPTLEQQKAALVKHMPLTPRMEQLLEIVRQSGEISFADLALKMNLDVSDLRSLLSIMTKRTNEIERYRHHRGGYVKYVGDNPATSQSSEKPESGLHGPNFYE